MILTDTSYCRAAAWRHVAFCALSILVLYAGSAHAGQVKYVEIPALPRASLSCTVRTDVTSPPTDMTIAWEMNTRDYEGTKSTFGDYSVVTVTVTVTNTGGEQAGRVRATLLLPENMALENGEQAIKLTQPSDLAPGETASASWKVLIIGNCLQTQRLLEVLITSEQGTPTRCSLPIIIAEKPCMVNLGLPDDVVGATGSTVVVPVLFRSGAVEPLQRYRLMIGFDQAHITFLDAVAEGSRTEAGWRGPRATVLPDPDDSRRAMVLVDDLTLQSDAAIDMGEEGVLVYLRFEVAFDPAFVLSGHGNVTQSNLDFLLDVTFPGNRRIIGAFNAAEESQYGTVMNVYSPGMVTVTSPCAWPLQWTARLEGNRPNPFNPSTTIAYTLETALPVTLIVLDIFGREIRQVDAGLRSAGRHEAVFDAGDLPGGVYFYRLQTPDVSVMRRMLFLR
ncbi:MAG: T9SS type A sorting domain-containing protein [Bacteroidetes bacterium]|nr:T9SS type A sorting domain-containing protein [Bacteroidota bacterium]